ncbi:MAG: hypothetical protein K0S09_149 [Sphingobacteriaceae bacterium]|jgi:hypothetical protein|nr:hypothetical protein [Sphingobacteriaceae bacterium]
MELRENPRFSGDFFVKTFYRQTVAEKMCYIHTTICYVKLKSV